MIGLLILATLFGIQAFDQEADWKNAKSFYDFHAPDLDGKDVSMEKYRGHVTIAFNGATHCPVAGKSFKLLQDLQKRRGESDGVKVATFIVDGLVYSSGTQQEIKEHVKAMSLPYEDYYGKIEIDGDNAHPIYKWFKSQLQDKILSASKILIDKNGQVIAKYNPTGSLKELEERMKQLL